MRCPICNTYNDDSLNFCEGCGLQIPHCPNCGKILTNQDRFCDNCGSMLPDDLLSMVIVDVPAAKEVSVQQEVAFCENCGQPCVPGNQYCAACEQELYDAQDDRPRIRVGLIVFLVIVLILIGLVFGGFAAVKSGLIELPSLDSLFIDREEADEDEKDSDEEDSGDSEGDGSGDSDLNRGDDDTVAAEDTTPSATEDTTEATAEPTTEPATEAPTEETTEATQATEESTQPGPDENDPLIYFINHCDSEYFDTDDLHGFSAEDCRYARNACYAKSGRKFNDRALQAYFEQFDWYNPTVSPNNFHSGMMNKYQVANLNLVLAYEASMGY